MNDTTTSHAIAEEDEAPARIIETDLPGRLDRLPWTRFHTLVVVALGITWVLDGLEVTVAGSIAGASGGLATSSAVLMSATCRPFPKWLARRGTSSARR